MYLTMFNKETNTVVPEYTLDIGDVRYIGKSLKSNKRNVLSRFNSDIHEGIKRGSKAEFLMAMVSPLELMKSAGLDFIVLTPTCWNRMKKERTNKLTDLNYIAVYRVHPQSNIGNFYVATSAEDPFPEDARISRSKG